jgi:hypothetical protein
MKLSQLVTLFVAALGLALLITPVSAGPYGGCDNPYKKRSPECATSLGFGGILPVTLPPDRPPTGTDTGIPIRGGVSGPIQVRDHGSIAPRYFRPR